MYMVRIRVHCDEVTHTTAGIKVKLTPVAVNSKENTAIFRFTPFGSINLETLKGELEQEFKPGAEYTVDFNRD